MSDAGAKTIEGNLAAERIEKLQESLITKRTWYISLAVASILASGGIAFTEFWMIAFVSFVLGLIFLSQYFDANGSLHEVKKRSTRTLSPDFSVLRRSKSESTSEAISPSSGIPGR